MNYLNEITIRNSISDFLNNNFKTISDDVALKSGLTIRLPELRFTTKPISERLIEANDAGFVYAETATEEEQAQTIIFGTDGITTYEYIIIVVLLDRGASKEDYLSLIRESLRITFKGHYDSIESTALRKIQPLEPLDLQEVKTQNIYMASAIKVTFRLAG